MQILSKISCHEAPEKILMLAIWESSFSRMEEATDAKTISSRRN
jgi:hypothetical protein